MQKVFCLYLMIISLSVSAADKALLIGVGKYQNNIKNLPGVAIDIETMKDSARILGFQEKNIRVLLNQQATKKNVIQTIEHWLIQDTRADDRILLYFSGHGSRIPDLDDDEEDGADEVLVMYDALIRQQNGRKTLQNALVDDELNRLLQRIPSHDVMLIVDACNSGTVYRAFSGLHPPPASPKFLAYPGMPGHFLDMNEKSLEEIDMDNSAAAVADTRVLSRKKDIHFIALTAAGDNELALATKNGSIFTRGINYYLKQAAINKHPLTPRELKEKVSDYIEDIVQKEQLGAVYQPRIAGDIALVNKAIQLSPVQIARVNWNRLLQLDVSRQKLLIKVPDTQLRLGQALTLDIDLPYAGYLNIISIDPNDEVSVLFPNAWDKSNKVTAGHFYLPTKNMDFDLQLAEPAGDNLILAILTQRPVNLYLQTINGRDLNGQMFGVLQQLADDYQQSQANQSTKSARQPFQYLSGKVIISAH